jgi:HPt (histidine-containing phosphotransfer) domain-containing protein
MLGEKYKEKIRNSVYDKFTKMGIDDASIEELIEISIDSLEEELNNITEILNKDELDFLGLHTHTIKGILLNVGLKDDAEEFQEIKHLFEAGKTKEEIKEITKNRIAIFKD